MIFVTVGSRNYPFDRLFLRLDELCAKGFLTEPVFAQIGTAAYRPRHYSWQEFLSPEEFDLSMRRAHIVVSHGATGSIMRALHYEKKVIAVTRLSKYQEHINDHQLQTNEAFSENGYVLMADPELKDLEECFRKIYAGKDHLRPWKNPDPLAIVRRIDRFINENWEDGTWISRN